jgi:hypothetical protein
MSHTYASVFDFKGYLIDGGDASWTQSDTTILTLLEGASRRIDEWCDRSRFGSGFGPRIGTNRYDAPAGAVLELEDDLLAITSVSGVSGGGTVTLTENTDVYGLPYEPVPYRQLSLAWTGSKAWGSDQRGTIIVGTWGYSNETYALATGGTLTSSATSLILTGGSAYAGQTLLIDSEQLYVTASGGTATVVRGVNGTTAATHAASAAVSAYRYPRDIVSACLQLTGRRQRSAQAGLTGDFGGGIVPVGTFRDTESSILKSVIGTYRFVAAG